MPSRTDLYTAWVVVIFRKRVQTSVFDRNLVYSRRALPTLRYPAIYACIPKYTLYRTTTHAPSIRTQTPNLTARLHLPRLESCPQRGPHSSAWSAGNPNYFAMGVSRLVYVTNAMTEAFRILIAPGG